MHHVRHLSLYKLMILAETVCTLAITRMVVQLLPIHTLVAWLDQLTQQNVEPNPTQQQIVQRIAGYVQLISRYTPWRSMCLEQAIAAKVMLHWRGIGSTLHLGVAKQGEALAAHAWLECAYGVVTGARGKKRFTSVVQVGTKAR